MRDVTCGQVLVLNQFWLAVHICSVRRAISLLYQGSAQVVSSSFDTYDFDSWLELSEYAESDTSAMIRAPGFSFRVPSVIVLRHYQKAPPRRVRFNRRNIYLRDKYECQYCGSRSERDELTIDHVIPRSRGGRSVWGNVVTACRQCNGKKRDRFPNECGMHPRASPKRPTWVMALSVHPETPRRETWGRFIDMRHLETQYAD